MLGVDRIHGTVGMTGFDCCKIAGVDKLSCCMLQKHAVVHTHGLASLEWVQPPQGLSGTGPVWYYHVANHAA